MILSQVITIFGVLFMAMLMSLTLLILEYILPKVAEVTGLKSLMRAVPKEGRVGTAVRRVQGAFMRGADLMVRDIGIS